MSLCVSPLCVSRSIITPSLIQTGANQVGDDTKKTVVSNNNKSVVSAPLDQTDNKSAAADKNNDKNKTSGKEKPESKVDPKKAKPAKTEKSGKENKKEATTDKKNDKTEEQKAGKSTDEKNKKPLSESGNVTSSKPLFRSDNDVTKRSKVGTQRGAENRTNRQNRGLATVPESANENADAERIPNLHLEDFDDIRPQDSISNVAIPPLRAYARGPNNTEHNRFRYVRARADTEVTQYSYPSGRYFPRLEYIPPRPAQATPLPRRFVPIEPSRRLYGRYYDRQDGRVYDYDVNYNGRRIIGDRRLLLR
ncbi:hypothetical protein ElyMa_004611800 [Elysia marginata]|uniref:OCRE domain-containing protein n=1 Tax=Elysia marginata TaxID=1093978 RepID=A0AAV4HXZ9_9GAST|nr:hypothetical protein ElyMa_004611800 [Elysia marginata]